MAIARPLRAFNKRALSTIVATALLATVLALAPASTTAAQTQNSPPIARAGADRAVALGSGFVTLDATRSFDIDGTNQVLDYDWDVLTSSYSLLVVTPTGFPRGRTATFISPSPSEAAQYGYTIQFRLTVTDPEGATGTDTVTLNFEGPPTAAIGLTAYIADPNPVDANNNHIIEDDERYTVPGVVRRPGQGGNDDDEWTVREGARVTLNGVGRSGLGASANSTLRFQWTRLSAVPSYNEFRIPFESRDDQDVTLLFPANLRQGQTAVVIYTLTVTSGTSQQVVASVRINVVDEPFAPEVELELYNARQPVQDANALNPDNPTLNYVVRPGATVELIARATDRDTGDAARMVHSWSGTGVTPASSNATHGPTSRATFSAPVNAPQGQTYVVTVTVSDPTNRTGRDVIVFTVADNNRPHATAPVDAVVDDGPRGGTNRQGLVILTGTGTDADGDTLRYRWFQADANGDPLDEPTLELMNADTATVSFVPPDVAGFSELEVYLGFIVIDQWGANDTDTVTVIVLGNINPPEADAGPNQSVAPGAQVRLDGSGSIDPTRTNRITSWRWTYTGFETTPPQSERPLTQFDRLALSGYLPTGNNYPNILFGATSAVPYFDAPTDLGGYTSLRFTFTLTVRDSTRATDTDTVTITVAGRFFTGVITGPDFCTNLSLGGPPTYALDSDRDGVADVCSLRTTRREAIARQNALTTLASLNPTRFSTQVLLACNRIAADFGDDPAKLALDACATSRVSAPPAEVAPQLADMFYSGPTITGPGFCTNLSLGGARLYPFDSNRDGVADLCVLPYTRREAVARQHALNAFVTPSAAFDNALALACRELGTTDFGDDPRHLSRDACA